MTRALQANGRRKGFRTGAQALVGPARRRARRAKGPMLVEVAIPKEACV